VDVIELVEMHSLMRSVLVSEKADGDHTRGEGPPVLAEQEEDDDDENAVADDEDDDELDADKGEAMPACPVKERLHSDPAGGEGCGEANGGWVGHVEVEMRKAVERQAQKANRSESTGTYGRSPRRSHSVPIDDSVQL